jgi:hypothetical protein
LRGLGRLGGSRIIRRGRFCRIVVQGWGTPWWRERISGSLLHGRALDGGVSWVSRCPP